MDYKKADPLIRFFCFQALQEIREMHFPEPDLPVAAVNAAGNATQRTTDQCTGSGMTACYGANARTGSRPDSRAGKCSLLATAHVGAADQGSKTGHDRYCCQFFHINCPP